MKKIIISDYDDTLKPIIRDTNGVVCRDSRGKVISDIKQLELNLEAIDEFRSEGNIFVLSTGRPFASIKGEIKKYNIPVDYLGCTDGSYLYDHDLHILKEYYFSLVEMKYIDKKLKKFNIDFVKDTFGHDAPSQYHSDITGIANKEEVINNFMNIFSKYRNIDPQYIDFKYVEWLLVRPKGISKITTGLDVLTYHTECKKNDIIAIGDGSNDIPMLREFEGYAVSHAYPDVKEVCEGREVSSVKELIMKL